MEGKRKIVRLKQKLMRKFTKNKIGQQMESEALQTFFKPLTDPLKKIKVASPAGNRGDSLKETPAQPKEEPDDKGDVPPPKLEDDLPFEEGTLPSSDEEAFEDPAEQDYQDVGASAAYPLPTTPTYVYTAKSSGEKYTPTLSTSHSASRRISTPPTLPSFGNLRTLTTLFPNEVLGQTSAHFLEKYFNKSKDLDTVFGMKYNFDTKELEIGDKTVKIFEDDIVIAGKQHRGRRQLWNLLFFKDLLDTSHSPDVLASYATILKDSNVIYQNNDPRTGKPKSSRGLKYTKIIKPIWEDIKVQKSGRGMTKKVQGGVVEYKYYDDPNELVDRLRLIYGSTLAGGDTHRNEIVEILTELEEFGIIDHGQKVAIHRNMNLDRI